MQMTNGFQLVYGDQVIQQNPAMYTQAPMYYQMPMQPYAAPGLEQQARLNQTQQRKPRGAGGTRPHGGRNYIGLPRTSSTGEEIREKGGNFLSATRESTHPYSRAGTNSTGSPERHPQPEQNCSPVIGRNMQVEQPGLAGVPVAYMPNGWQAPVLISHNGTGIDPNWMAGASALHPQLQYQYQQPTDGTQQYYGLPMVYHP